MPFLRPPNMIPSVDEEAIQEEFNLKQIDAPMPEAPWVKRCLSMVDYKDKLEDCTTSLYFEKSPSKSPIKTVEPNKFSTSARIRAAREDQGLSIITESDICCAIEDCKHPECILLVGEAKPEEVMSDAYSDFELPASLNGSILVSDSLVNLQAIKSKPPS